MVPYLEFPIWGSDCHHVMTSLFEANTVINFLPLYSANIDNEPCWYPESLGSDSCSKRIHKHILQSPPERLGCLGREHRFKDGSCMVNVMLSQREG